MIYNNVLYEAPFFIIDQDGASKGPFQSLDEALKVPVFKDHYPIGDLLFCEGRLDPGAHIPHRRLAPAIAKDVYGRTVPGKLLQEVMSAPFHLRWQMRLLERRKHWSYRRSPVPHTGRPSGGSWFRSPRTTCERRAWHAAYDEDTGHPIKGLRRRRSGHNLRNAWDDVLISKPRRSWKENRRTQYKQAA